MIFGMDSLTLVHVALSIAGLLSGFAFARAMIAEGQPNSWTSLFLITTAATSITGFLFPFAKLLPSHVVGIISLVVLVPAFFGYYGARQSVGWRTIFAATAMAAFYLNAFVLTAQLFQKVPALRALAPTQSEAPFLIAQLALLAGFFWFGTSAVRNFRVQEKSPE